MLEITCDGDHGYRSGAIEDGSEIYCGDCYDELKEKFDDLQNELEEAKNNLAEAENTIGELESKVEELEAE